MSKDLHTILEGWDHDPDDLQVRIVQGLDGREKLQMRVELGLLQMELEGRPDGHLPHGLPSLLDYHEARAADPANTNFHLNTDDCAELMREGVQYYHRYLSLFQLQRYDLVARDTARNLRLFAFVLAHAERDRDKVQFDQYRPYVTMMNTRAHGLQALDHGDSRAALNHIDHGIQLIRQFLQQYDQQGLEDQCQELVFLQQWRKKVLSERKLSPLERLEEQLAHAIESEDYELAASLRDQLARIRLETLGSSRNLSADPPDDDSINDA